jgi:hypothetical protein
MFLYLAPRSQTAARTAFFRGYVTQFPPVAACNPIALYRTAQILKSHFATSSNYNESSWHSCWHKQLCIIFIYRVTALFAEGVNITPPNPLKNRVWWTCHAYAAKSSNNSTILTATRHPPPNPFPTNIKVVQALSYFTDSTGFCLHFDTNPCAKRKYSSSDARY